MTENMSSAKGERYAAVLIIILFGIFAIVVNFRAADKRVLPSSKGKGAPVQIIRVNTQRDVYGIYRAQGLRGAKVIHLNRFFNLVDFFPEEEVLSAPFPLRISDSLQAYERGLDSHNWLFIAARTGMARSVTSVLPDGDFQEKSGQFFADPAMTHSGGKFRTYTFDIPWTITALEGLPRVNEPVVVNVDAGFFAAGAHPKKTAELLRSRLKDIRMVVVIQSHDEPDIPAEARSATELFETLWKTL